MPAIPPPTSEDLTIDLGDLLRKAHEVRHPYSWVEQTAALARRCAAAEEQRDRLRTAVVWLWEHCALPGHAVGTEWNFCSIELADWQEFLRRVAS